MPEVLPKIKALKQECVKRNAQCDIEVDGGINFETAKEVVKAGANVLVAGSAIFYAKDYREVICGLKTI
jgi:ribulose-phosphate 3-epimerase